jgi:hypothetical protein
VAEGDGLLNRYTGNSVSGVRIPLSPPTTSTPAFYTFTSPSSIPASALTRLLLFSSAAGILPEARQLQRVRREIAACQRALRGGVAILAPECAAPLTTPVENCASLWRWHRRARSVSCSDPDSASVGSLIG